MPGITRLRAIPATPSTPHRILEGIAIEFLTVHSERANILVQ
jgi:hypothetical protein